MFKTEIIVANFAFFVKIFIFSEIRGLVNEKRRESQSMDVFCDTQA